MKRLFAMIMAVSLCLSMSVPAFAGYRHGDADRNDLSVGDSAADCKLKREAIIKEKLSDTTLSNEAEKFLEENNISLDSKLVSNAPNVAIVEKSSEYVGILNEEILALKRAAQAYGFTQQQIQAYVTGLMNTPTEVIFEEDTKRPSVLPKPISTRIPDDGIGYEVQSSYGYTQATSYVTLPTRNINNLNDIAYLFYTAYSPSTNMDFGVRGGMYSWVSSFTPVQGNDKDGIVIGKYDGDRVYFNISVENDGWLRCKILDANDFSNELLNVLYQMSGVKKNKMIFNKQITLCNNYASFTSGSSISHGKFSQSYLYTTTSYSIMNSYNTNPNRRGAFGGNQVTVHDYTQWGSEDVSISFN